VESGLCGSYACLVEQDPRYLRNQSRHLHRKFRRYRRLLNIFAALWVAAFSTLLAACALDWVFDLGWGFSRESAWSFVAAICWASIIWVFWMLVLKIALGFVRHTYGPEPLDRELES